MNRWLPIVLGVVLFLVGAVWTLQGSGVIAGSVMTGSKFWLVVGLVLLVAGGALVIRTVRAGMRRS
ncbi:hypothetical protein [Pseudonocardia sp. GCM10023141]|uniref:hypothetical protein n=1 Tax=Pseudonocardia sp. GCM10023141 TaxID=3252653 RepID=UPI0036242727